MMNTAKPIKSVKTCSCGQEFIVETRNQRSCPTCIEAKKAYEAARPRPLRICEVCGAESRECRHKMCPVCMAAVELQRKRNHVHIGDYWYSRDYVMCEAKHGEGNHNDALPHAINGCLSRIKQLSRGKALGELEIHLLTIARQDGVVSTEWCNNLLDTVKIHTRDWAEQVDHAFFECFGRPLDRTNNVQIAADLATLKGMDKHPYIGNPDRAQTVLAAYNKKHANRKGRWGEPLGATDPNWKPTGDEQAQSRKSIEREVDQWLEEKGLGRYGALPGCQSKAAAQEKQVNPEQEEHDNQDAIDAIAGDLLGV